MPTLVIRHPDGRAEERELDGRLTIGRADGNDLVLSEGGVSRTHAQLTVVGDRVEVEDIGSANGTFIDGQRIEGATALTPTAVLEIGAYELRVRPSPLPAVDAPPAPRQTRMVKAVRGERALPARRAGPASSVEPAPEGPTLRGLTGPWMNQLFPVRGTMIAGRVPGAEIHLDDDSVSRRHAEVERTPAGAVVVRDLGSANGTAVNGTAIEGQVELLPGDVLQLGMIELVLEGGEQRQLPVRRTRGGLAARAEEVGAAAGGGGSAKWGVAIGVALLLAFGLKTVLFPSRPRASVPSKANSIETEVGLGAEVDRQLAECRSFSSPEVREPDWARADAACNKALDLDPIHPEALQLRKKIREEQECEASFAKGERELLRQDEARALELFGKITPACSYYLKAKPKVSEALDAVKKASGRDCRSYAANDQWTEALSACERYMKLACQNMPPEALRPPVNHRLVLTSGRLKRNQWRPADPLYLAFLRARDKVDPAAPPWECPAMAILRKEQGPPDPRVEVRGVFAQRFPDRDLAAAMLFYFDGKSSDAINVLLRVRERQDRASIHASADELRKDITLVQQLYNEGQGNLQAQDPEKAAGPFREAMEVDKKLMGDLFDKAPSFFRRNVRVDMGAHAFDRGKAYAERGDVRRGCRVWKLGYSFYKGNVELLQALSNTCIHRASRAFDEATTCDDLAKVEDLSVEGDGLAPRLVEKRAELSCP